MHRDEEYIRRVKAQVDKLLDVVLLHGFGDINIKVAEGVADIQGAPRIRVKK